MSVRRSDRVLITVTVSGELVKEYDAPLSGWSRSETRIDHELAP